MAGKVIHKTGFIYVVGDNGQPERAAAWTSAVSMTLSTPLTVDVLSRRSPIRRARRVSQRSCCGPRKGKAVADKADVVDSRSPVNRRGRIR